MQLGLSDGRTGTLSRMERADLDEYAAGAIEALRIAPDEGFLAFLETVGVEHLRGVRVDGRLVAGAGFIPSAQRFGGAWVPSALVTAVWAAPAIRGRGVASGLMRALLADLHEGGYPISALYPANLALYRRVGYEIAAMNHCYVAPLVALDARPPSGWRADGVEGVTPQAPGILAPLYAEALPRLGPGAVERHPALWHAALCWNESGRTSVFVALSPAGEPRGYLVADSKHSSPRICVRELLALEPDATRTLLAHLAGYRGIFETAQWPGGPFDPTALELRDEPAEVRPSPLMLRVIDPAAALAARGYPAGVVARLELAVEGEDPLVLTLDGSGSGNVSGGGSGAIGISLRALAPLYTGFAGPRELERAGTLNAAPETLDALTTAFAGPSPWLSDRF